MPQGSVAAFTLVTTADGIATLTAAVAGHAGPVGLDIETSGLSPARDRVRLIQMAVGDEVYIIDLFALPDPADALAPLFAALVTKEVAGHNVVAFDLPFLSRLGFAPERVYDTLLASKVLHAGVTVKAAGAAPDAKGAPLKHGLADGALRELNRVVAKGEQKSVWAQATLSPSQLQYAAADAAVLLPLAAALKEKVATAGLMPVAELEMNCAIPVVRMAATGVGFDAAAWVALADAAADRRAALAAEMDALVPNPGGLPGLASWNWNSATGDVLNAFEQVGITLADSQEETLAGVDHPLAGLLLEYREADKRATAYGRKFVDQFVTGGRVYATWNPCEAKTGRMSCKGPNLQQVPRAKPYRRCFAARPGHVLVKSDFSQVELRIAAKVTGDKRMLAAYVAGEDLHALTAGRFLGGGEVTPEARQMAKPVNFGAIYGLGSKSLRRKAKADYGKDMTEGQAQGFLDAFFAEFPGVRAWHQKLKRRGLTAVRTLGGRRVAVDDDHFFGAKANYIVQGSGGDGLKRALVLLWQRRAELPNARVVLAVHDEIVVEVPEEDAGAATGWVKRAMADGIAPLIAPVPIVVDATVGRTWGG